MISPHRSFRSALITFILTPAKSVAFDSASFRFVYKSLVKYEKSHHEVQRNLNLIGIDTSENKWRILPKIEFKDLHTVN